ncbi:MAG: OsmC family protein, partial [Geminicoccaceae bacterium]
MPDGADACARHPTRHRIQESRQLQALEGERRDSNPRPPTTIRQITSSATNFWSGSEELEPRDRSEPVRARVSFKVDGALVGPTEVNPVEYALASLASCQAITYRFWADKLGIRLDGLEIAAEGDLDLHG